MAHALTDDRPDAGSQVDFEFATLRDGSGGVSEQTGSTTIDTSNIPFDFTALAIGAFSGSNGLSAPESVFHSQAEMDAYEQQLLAKHTQILAQPVSILIGHVTAGVFALGGSAADTITATDTVASSTLYAGAGDDTIAGGASGGERLYGGDGNDLLYFNGVDDHLSGGHGDDTFAPIALAGLHMGLVGDFAAGDVVSLAFLDADPSTLEMDAWTRVRHFDGSAGEVRLHYRAAQNRTQVQFDSDGDGRADHLIDIHGDHTGAGLLVV